MSDDPAKTGLKEAFCPDDDSWRRAILKRGRDLLREILRQTHKYRITKKSR
jgi:hypothetical protein